MSSQELADIQKNEMFRPPVDRTMRLLNPKFFEKTVTLAAAKVFEVNQITNCRKALGKDVLDLERVPSVQMVPSSEPGGTPTRGILLRPEIRPNDLSTWTSSINELAKQQKISIAPFTLTLGYDHWTYSDIMHAILPDDVPDEIPQGFNTVGHIAHLNLRDGFQPYKHLIAQVIIDKNSRIKTVINKIESVGSTNPYRTFPSELLAGDPSMMVEVRELDCVFRFDYSKVYWNSKLNTEHRRLVELFQPGEAVCDVMAGVGPFAIPAGKKRVFVWACDLNPDSYNSLIDAISRNKVDAFVDPFNRDGRDFIRESARELEQQSLTINTTPKPKYRPGTLPGFRSPPPPKTVLMKRPKVFSHYVMNLPASAITFLDAFRGLYHGREYLFQPHTAQKLPMVHVYCFSTKSEDNVRETKEICEEISQHLGFTIEPGTAELSIHDVRDVAPQKRMFCASFRLPEAVTFASPYSKN